MSCTCAPALNKLKSQLDQAFPNRDTASEGCCGDEAHASTKSDHNPTNGYAHARDVDENLVPNTGDKPLLPWISDLLKDDRAKYCIYERKIYYARCATHGSQCFSAGGHAYSGANAHDKHLHISIWTSSTFDTSPWVLPFGLPDIGGTMPTFENLGGNPAQDYLIASTQGGHIHAISCDPNNNRPWHKWWNGSSWSGWNPIGGTEVSLKNPRLAVRGDTVSLFGIGSNGALYHVHFNGTAWQ